MHEVSYTLNAAKNQRDILGDALDTAEASGAVDIPAIVYAYHRASVAAVDLELALLQAEPPSGGDGALYDNLWMEHAAKRDALAALDCAACTRREYIDAHVAAMLTKERWGIVCDRIEAKGTYGVGTRRGKRRALMHGNKIKTGKFVRINGERVPVLRTVR